MHHNIYKLFIPGEIDDARREALFILEREPDNRLAQDILNKILRQRILDYVPQDSK